MSRASSFPAGAWPCWRPTTASPTTPACRPTTASARPTADLPSTSSPRPRRSSRVLAPRAEQHLLGDRRHVGAVGREHLTDRQTPRAQQAMALEVVGVPVVGRDVAMEPDRVVEAGTPEREVLEGALLRSV